MKLPKQNATLAMDEFIDNAMKKIRDDLEFYEVVKQLNPSARLVKDNITKFLEFQADYHYCKNCPGIDKCAKNTPHLQLSLKPDGQFVDIQYSPCEKLIEQVKRDSLYMYSDFPEEWKNSLLRTLDSTSNERRKTVDDFVKILNGNSKKWIYIYGEPKTGKSYVLATFANEYAIGKKMQIAFIDASTRFQLLNDLSRFNRAAFESEMLKLSNVSLLVIDGFGNEYKNDYIRDSIILPLLLDRSRNNKPTFFSSSFSIDQIVEMYSTSRAGSIRAKQLGSLLKSECAKEYNFYGISLY